MAATLPAVSFLKAPAFQDGHAGYSNPIDEQAFIVKAVNAVQKSKFWTDTAIVILYDDSDGWYDHQMPPIVNPSFDPDGRRAERPRQHAIAACSRDGRRGRRRSTAPSASRPGAAAATAPASRSW